MRVIRCPNCDEPLPGTANYCAACGEFLSAPGANDSKLQPPALKVPHFYAMGNDSNSDESDKDEGTLRISEIVNSTTLKIGQQSPSFAISTINTTPIAQEPIPQLEAITISINDSHDRTDWLKVVDSRPLRLPRPPALLTPIPLRPHAPLTAVVVPPPREPRHARPSWFFWVSMLAILALVLGGLFGVAVTLGHGNNRPLPTHAALSLQVTPTSVAFGRMITLRGSNFTPNGQVGLSRDANIPMIDTGGNTIISANSEGSFSDTIIVEPGWLAGSHLIRAEDARTHKSASFTIIVTGDSASLRPAHLLLSTNGIDLGSGDQATNSLKTITLTNAGGGQISWQTTVTQPWLMLSPTNGTFSSNVQVTVAGDRSNLKPGSYTAKVIFSSSTGQMTLPIKMSVTPLQPGHEAVLQLTPAVLSFTGVDGGASPPAQVVTVSNPGVRPLQWGVSTFGDSGWLSVSPRSGTVTKGGSEPALVSVNISALLPGTYSAWVIFAGQGSETVKDSPQSVFVSLTIVPQCALQVSPGDLSFTAVYLQPAPPSKVVGLSVTQGCSTQLRWSASSATNNGGRWLSIRSTGGITPSYQLVSVNVAGLAPGVYTGTIIFSSTTGTQTLPVVLTMGHPTTPIMATLPAAVTFSGVIGQSNPPAQAVNITNTGGGTLNWQVTASTAVGGQWLAAAPAAGTLDSHQSATVSVTATLLKSLIPGTYNGTITINGAGALGSPQSIPVTFIVQAPCTIAAAPVALTFAGVAGQPNPPNQATTITASGACAHTLNWKAAAATTPGGGTWLTTTPATGTVSLTASSTTNVGIVLAGLGAGTYTGTVTITATDSVTGQPIGTPQVVAVTLSVQPPCTLQSPSTTGETFSAEAGLNPATQTFTIAIIGACTGNVTITPTVTLGSGTGWLAVTPPSATITSGSATFTVVVTSAALAAGPYTGSISIAAIDGGMAITGSPQTVGVTLNVLAPPTLTVSPGSLTFNVITGTTSQPFTIGNSGGEPLNWTAALASGAPSFVSLSADAGTDLAAGANASVNVLVNATGVPGGSSFTTSVMVNAINPLTGNPVAGSPATVSITINVSLPAMQVNPTSLSFTATVGNNPPTQTITITNTGGDGLTWTAGAPDQPWLTVSPTSGSDASGGNSTLTFSVNVTGMAAGPYSSNVIITPSVGAPVTVIVTLTIN